MPNNAPLQYLELDSVLTWITASPISRSKGPVNLRAASQGEDWRDVLKATPIPVVERQIDHRSFHTRD